MRLPARRVLYVFVYRQSDRRRAPDCAPTDRTAPFGLHFFFRPTAPWIEAADRPLSAGSSPRPSPPAGSTSLSLHPDEGGKEKTTETASGITSLPLEEANEHRLIALNRRHWSIENKLHLPYREDHSRICKPNGAHALASLKNLAIGLHALGVFNTRKSPSKTISKMNRKLVWHPQNAINFCITPYNKRLLQ